MNRVDEFCKDLQMLIDEHKMLEIAIEKIAKYESAIKDIKAEIRQKQWYLGVDSVNQVIEIIDKYKAESEVRNEQIRGNK